MPQFLQNFFDQAPSVLLLVFGFGFVIFWHELGHFLAAKWAGVKVDQFAIGFGQALLCWRKGLGLTVGTSAKKVESLAIDHLAKTKQQSVGFQEQTGYTRDQIEGASRELGISETEYRLNWIPLGGYVKMLGQDDLDPNAKSADPRAFNNKPISKRMVIVSAGVIMNVILALIGFFALFLIGYNAPPPVVGFVQPGSPAQEAGIEVGDRILTIDGRPQRDFTKIQLNVALVSGGQSVPVVVQHPGGGTQTLSVTPRPKDGDSSGLLMIGIGPSAELRGPEDSPRMVAEIEKTRGLLLPDQFAIHPGDVITEINGVPISTGDPKRYSKDYYKLFQALQQSDGKPITVVSKGKDGSLVTSHLKPEFADSFAKSTLNFAGLQPRSMVDGLQDESTAREKLFPGDVIVELRAPDTQDSYLNPGIDRVIDKLTAAGKDGRTVDIVVLRDGKRVEVKGLEPTVNIGNGRRGLGIAPGGDIAHPVVGQIRPGSPAAAAGIPENVILTAIGGQPIADWHDVFRILKSQSAGKVAVTYTQDGRGATKDLELSEKDLREIRSNRYSHNVMLHDLSEPRQTSSPVEAAMWGVEETRDLMIQFYFTIVRMFQGSVSAKNATGPIGIVDAGIRVANSGWDRLLWFLCMISANLAVVNFLPIPIVDGGLFVFLILEKVKGRPLSPKAQSIAQLVGLALILSVFVFVTYHDIVRLFGRA